MWRLVQWIYGEHLFYISLGIVLIFDSVILYCGIIVKTHVLFVKVLVIINITDNINTSIGPCTILLEKKIVMDMLSCDKRSYVRCYSWECCDNSIFQIVTQWILPTPGSVWYILLRNVCDVGMFLNEVFDVSADAFLIRDFLFSKKKELPFLDTILFAVATRSVCGH